MKLIDLLVQELPKRGGWPEGAHSVLQSGYDTELYFYDENEDQVHRGINLTYQGEDARNADITREQYEAALKASQQQAWNGGGIPPVGCECELFDCEDWNPVVIKFVGDKYIVTERTDLGCEVVYCLAGRPEHFRPMRAEENRKRHESLYALEQLDIDSDITIRVLDAISAGKIPHITLK